MICSSVNLERFMVHLFPRDALYLNLEEIPGLRSDPGHGDPIAPFARKSLSGFWVAKSWTQHILTTMSCSVLAQWAMRSAALERWR